MKTTRRRGKVFAIAAAASLVLAACGGDDDDGGSEGTDAPTESSEAPDEGGDETEATEAPDEGDETEMTEAPDEGGDETEPTEAPDETEPTEAPDGTEPDEGAAGGYDWSDVNRRKAVSMAIDRQAITENIFLGARAPADDWWPSTFVGYREGACANLQYDPETAKQLWDEAGGTTGPITFWFNSGADHELWIEAVSNQLKENLGVEEVSFESLQFADYLDKLDNAEINGPFRLGWLADYPSPGNFLTPLHGTAGSSNHTGYSNPEFDELAAAGDSKSLEDAVADYQAAGDILCEDVPFSPMFYGQLQAVYSPNVANVSFDSFQALNVEEVEDVDGDGAVSMYICEPQNGLYGAMTGETCGSEVVSGLFTGLWSLDKDSGEIVYDGVAESAESNEDATEWTITLKEGWTFHDGTPVTSESFVNAWTWAADGRNAAENQYFMGLIGMEGYDALNPPDDDGDSVPDQEPADGISGLSAPDPQTIEIKLTAPFPQLQLVMLYNAFDPLPESFYDDPEAFGEAPIGNGPLMMDGSWEHDVQIATVAYPDYAGTPVSYDSLTYRIYSDIGTAYNDVRAGSLDVVDQVPQAELGNFKTEFPDNFIEEATSSFNYLGFPIDLELAASWHAG